MADGLNPEGASIQMLAEATGQPAADIAEVIREMNDTILGQLTELAGEEAVRDALSQPGWNAAMLAGISANLLLPMARFLAGRVEQQQSHGR